MFLLLLGNVYWVHWVTFIATASVIRQQFGMKIWLGSNVHKKHGGWMLSVECSLFIPVHGLERNMFPQKIPIPMTLIFIQLFKF